MNSLLVTDPEWAKQIIAEREERGIDKYDEVWEGVYVVPAFKRFPPIRVLAPIHDNEHRRIVMNLCIAFQLAGPGEVYPGVAVSDRREGWESNYRIPDVVVVRSVAGAEDCGTHLYGGPDLAVEIQCPGPDARQKLPFYMGVNTREVLIIDRDPWRLELFQLKDGVLEPAGESDLANPAVLTSAVLPLSFELRSGPTRPIIHMTHTGTGQTWTA